MRVTRYTSIVDWESGATLAYQNFVADDLAAAQSKTAKLIEMLRPLDTVARFHTYEQSPQ